MKTLRALSILVLAVLAVPSLLSAQSGPELMRNALSAQADRLAGIENVTIVQEVMGMETSVRMEKTDLNGTPVLMPTSVTVMGMTQPIPADQAQTDWTNPFQEAWVEKAMVLGQETLDGHRVHHLAIEDFSDLDIPSMPGSDQGQGEMMPTSVQFWLDADDFVTRKVVMDMTITRDDGTSNDVHMELFMEDYRDVEGYLHPFVTRAVTQGLMEGMDMDQDEVRAQLDELKAQMESMPEAQRNMLAGMLEGQIKQLESMLGGDEGMEFVITVKELTVNSGVPR
jgi:hypothetical protein